MKLRRGGRAASAAVESWIWGRMSRVAVGGKSWERKSDSARLGVLARSDPVQSGMNGVGVGSALGPATATTTTTIPLELPLELPLPLTENRGGR